MPVIAEAAAALSELEVQTQPRAPAQAVTGCQRSTIIFHQQFLSSSSTKQAQKGEFGFGGPLA